MAALASNGKPELITRREIFRVTWKNLFKLPLSETKAQNWGMRMKLNVQLANAKTAKAETETDNVFAKFGLYDDAASRWEKADRLALKIGREPDAWAYAEKAAAMRERLRLEKNAYEDEIYKKEHTRP